MKDRLLTIVMLLATVGITSCSDEDLKKGSPVEIGSEIKFGASLDPETRSRTHYGDKEFNDPTSTIWPIYWNYPDNLDQIFIYSPQGVQGRNQAKYTVNPAKEDQNTAATITKIGDFGVQAGDAETYDFYALYPASSVRETADNGIIYGTLSPEQSVTFAGSKAQAATVVPDAPVQGTGDAYDFLTTPDMSGCLMTASNTGVTLTTEESVKLAFKPFSSVLDITVSGPASTNTTPECLVTSVMIIADAPIAGDFSYDFTKTTLEEAFKIEETNATDTIEVSTLSLDKQGNLVGIPMGSGNTLRLQAFLLPNPAVKDIKVKVFTSDAQTWTQKLNLTNNGTQLFKPSQIHKVVLPLLNIQEAQFNYNQWLSQLDPRIYLSEISLPGSTSSFSWKEGSTNAMQTLTAKQQFEAGIRVFRCHIWLYDMASSIDNQSPSFGININGTTYVRPMAEVITELYNEMKDNHPDEFCILMVSDYKQIIAEQSTDSQGNIIPASPASATWNRDNGRTFYTRFKRIVEEMVNLGYLPNKIDANTTLGDVKGKVLLKLQLNANGTDEGWTSQLHVAKGRPEDIGGVMGYEDMNNVIDKISAWSEVNDTKALMNWWTARNGSALFYAPMNFGDVGSFTFDTQFTNSSSGKGSVTITQSGLAADAVTMLVDKATWRRPGNYPSSYWMGNCSVTSVPDNFDDPSQMWYVYGAQANPSDSREWTAAQTLVTEATDAIRLYYHPDGNTFHNKFFMTYLGGNGSEANATTVTTTLVPAWNTAVDATAFGKNRPFGWVLFNTIPSIDKADNQLTNAEDLVRKGVQKVISRNNDINFKLKRKLNNTPTPAAAPSGDVKGTQSGGSLFK